MSEYVIKLDDFEKRLIINGLNGFKSDLSSKGQPTEDVNSLILKVINAPQRKHERETR